MTLFATSWKFKLPYMGMLKLKCSLLGAGVVGSTLEETFVYDLSHLNG